MNLYQYFLDNPGFGMYKWEHYFPIYERHFDCWRNKSVTVIEIGVFKGGSLELWSKYFGPHARVIGIDINPDCVKYDKNNPYVRIGDQQDTNFLNSIIGEFGTPDIIIDDGSHKMSDVVNTFNFLYPQLSKNGVYLIEDVHTSYWPEFDGGLHYETTINRSKNHIDELNAYHSRGLINPTIVTNITNSITYYDSVIVYERGLSLTKKSTFTGSND
ncbi:MAG: class I SAM-dependent methyltransferase [Caulobacteraceae bacterium]|nr:class I SAM-dependent methyltransferase [Caulobacteraceae bacterium]